MNYKRILLLSTAVILIVLPITIFSTTLHLKDYTLVFNKNIYLSDIVKERIPYTDDMTVGSISSNSTFTFVLQKIKNIKFDKDKIEIKYIKIDNLSKRIESLIEYKLPKKFKDCQVNIKSKLPKTNDLDILLQNYPPIGWVSVRLLKNGKYYRTAGVYCKVKEEVFVSKTDIRPKELITKNDVEKTLLDVTTNYRNIPETVIGMMARYYIHKGSVIYTNYIMQPLDVIQGQTVLMIVKYKNILINDYGIALSDGKIGDIIRIMNIKSRNIVIGKVVQKGMVEVIIK